MVSAAIAATRSGARTCLIEVRDAWVGGWTVVARIGENRERYACDIEAIKLLLESLCVEAGVDVCLHTRA